METNSMNNIDIEFGSKLNLNDYNKKSNDIGCRLVPKDNKYSSTESTRVPTTESDNVLLNTNDTITKIEYTNNIEQDTKENNIDDKENNIEDKKEYYEDTENNIDDTEKNIENTKENYEDTELKDEDFVFSDYKSYNKICNQVIDKYNLELSKFSYVLYWNPDMQNFLDKECKSFVRDLDLYILVFKDRVFNELRLLSCYTKDKKIFKDKEKRNQVINKLKMLPEIKMKFKEIWILEDILKMQFYEELKEIHDEKVKMINEIINAQSDEIKKLIEYNKRLYDTGFFTTFKNNLTKLHPDDYYCKMMGIRFIRKIVYKCSRIFSYYNY